MRQLRPSLLTCTPLFKPLQRGLAWEPDDQLTTASGQRDLPHRGSGGCVDEGWRLGEAALDIAPATHDDLHLAESAARVGGCQGNHPGPALSHSGDLQAVLLDVAVPGDD